MLFVVLANRMQNRQRRAIELSRDATRDLTRAAMAHLGQPLGAAKNRVAFIRTDLREVRPALHLIAMRCKEAIDAAEQKADASLTVREKESPRRQTAPT